MKDPVGMISELGDGQSLRAQGTVVDRPIRITFHLYDLAVLHMGDDAASSMTASANGGYLPDFFHSNPLCLLPETSTCKVNEQPRERPALRASFISIR
jgi:hypothetical protein